MQLCRVSGRQYRFDAHMTKARAWREKALKKSHVAGLEQQITQLPPARVAFVVDFQAYVARTTELMPVLLDHYGSSRHRMWAKKVSSRCQISRVNLGRTIFTLNLRHS